MILMILMILMINKVIQKTKEIEMKNTIKTLMIMGALFQGTATFAVPTVIIASGQAAQNSDYKYTITSPFSGCESIQIDKEHSRFQCGYADGTVDIKGKTPQGDVSCGAAAHAGMIGGSPQFACGDRIHITNTANNITISLP